MPDKAFLGTKVKTGEVDPPFKYEWISYGEAVKIAKKLAAGMMKLGLVPVVDDYEKSGMSGRFLGLQAKNRAEWYLCELAGFYSGATTVALMDTQSAVTAACIIDQTELTTLALSGERVEAMIKLKEAHKDGLMKRLSNIVLFDPVDTFLQELAAKNGIRLVSYDDVLKAGDVGNTQLNRCKTEDIFCLCYTSGTTGVPKGVKLSH